MIHSRFRLFMLLSLFTTVLFVGPVASYACTGMRVIAKDGSVVWVRSMEFGTSTKSDIMIVPRGMAWTSSAPDGQKGLQWTNEYAFIGPNGFAMESPLEGMNEKGLYVGGFWMAAGESEYPKSKSADYSQTISQVDLGAWLLSNCASVAEVKERVPQLQLTGVEVEFLHMSPLVHWSVVDASGKAVVIESIGGVVTVSENPVGVFTNAPSFGWHLDHLRMYINLRPGNVQPFKLGDYKITPLGQGTGLLGLPGDQTPPSRFVRAAFYANTALQPEDADGSVTLGMNLIANFSIPKGLSSGIGGDGKQEFDYTQWTTVYDFSRKSLYFRTYDDQDYKKVSFDKLPLDGKKPLFIPMWNVKPAYADVSGQAKTH